MDDTAMAAAFIRVSSHEQVNNTFLLIARSCLADVKH